MGDRSNALAQKVTERFPRLKRELDDAGIAETPVEYMSAAIWKSSAAALLASVASGVAFVAGGKPAHAASLLIGVFAFAAVMFLHVYRPGQLMRSRARRIETGLVFSLQALNIELASGIGFPQALEDVARMDYGEFSSEMRKILDDSHKWGLRRAFKDSTRRNPSVIYRRVVWQMINALETGADMKGSLSSIIEDLRRRQENEAQRYGKSMERQLTLYVLGGIVLPALAAVMVQATSTLGVGGFGGERIYLAILAASISVQLIFLYMIKFGKPAIMGGSFIKVAKKTGIRAHMSELLDYAGVDSNRGGYLLSRLLACTGFGLLLAFILGPYAGIGYTYLSAITVSFFFVAFYTRLAYKADERGEKAALYLPDSLRIMAANMEAGVATDQALFMSAREEFGVLGDEIRLMGTDMIKNLTFEEALSRLKKRIKSEPLHMSANLIGHGLKAGRGLASSLLHVSDILQEREYVRRAVATQLVSVRSTVLILVVLSAPLLYSTSIVAGSVMGRFSDKMRSSLPEDISHQGWLKNSSQPVSADFLNRYYMASLMAISVLGSVIVGEVTTGKAKEGLRYVFMMAFASETLYLVLKEVISGKVVGVII
ncbi:MAG: type II secretion system F family protein [Candidatus Altiarchaeota archaeon]